MAGDALSPGALIQAERPEEAADILDAAVRNSSWACDPNHVMTLEIRLSHLDAVSDAGDLAGAVHLADALTEDSTRQRRGRDRPRPHRRRRSRRGRRPSGTRRRGGRPRDGG